ncbi:MAG TPA: spore germination protein GerW family protein [Acidimicrobiia bacterium]|nr:spore germination protein GerW family protein [Acidimicrobiia bacterium]
MSNGIHDIGDRIDRSLERLFGETSPNTVFSAPEAIGDDLVIVASAWERTGGFGYGAGSGNSESTGDQGEGGGGGGGGVSLGRPVAVIRVGASGIQVEPVVDFTKIAVTVLLAAVGVWRAMR